MKPDYSKFRPVSFAWMKEEQAANGYLKEWPSESDIYAQKNKQHEDAYSNEDLIYAFAVADPITGSLYLKLESLRFNLRKFVPIPDREMSDTEYAKEFEDPLFLEEEKTFFDEEIDELRRMMN